MSSNDAKHVNSITRIGRSIVDFLLPSRCIITGEIVQGAGMLSGEGWSQLSFITDPMCQICGIPFDVVEDDDDDGDGANNEDGLGGKGHDRDHSRDHCARCLDRTPMYEFARAALRYDDGVRGLILSYKHGDKTHMAVPFSQWMTSVADEVLDGADILVPVPLHWTRLVKRRYNQAALLTHCLSKLTGVPKHHTALIRTRRTKVQGLMSGRERHNNVRSAFIVPDKYRGEIESKVVVLVDDVYTTGATVGACSKAIMQAGAKSVRVLCLARVIHD